MSVLKASQSRIISRAVVLIIAAMLISGCASKKEKEILSKEEIVELYQKNLDEQYVKAKKSLNKGNYAKAVEQLVVLQRVFPFGDISEQSRLDTLFALNKLQEREAAIKVADNFISLYPTHPNVDYAYYMKGVVMFEKKTNRFAKFLNGGSDKLIRDPQGLRDSQASLQELVKRYPESKYADDARQRLVYIANKLAKRELDVAQFYYDNDTYIAAVNRAKTVVYQFGNTPSVEGALVLMEKSYAKMGLPDLAQSTHEMLMTNFPENQAARDKKAKKKGFLSRINPF